MLLTVLGYSVENVTFFKSYYLAVFGGRLEAFRLEMICI